MREGFFYFFGWGGRRRRHMVPGGTKYATTHVLHVSHNPSICVRSVKALMLDVNPRCSCAGSGWVGGG